MQFLLTHAVSKGGSVPTDRDGDADGWECKEVYSVLITYVPSAASCINRASSREVSLRVCEPWEKSEFAYVALKCDWDIWDPPP